MNSPISHAEKPRVPPHGQLADDMAATRSSLVRRLRKWDDQKSWQTFFNTYWKLIFSVALRQGLSDAEANDAAQETLVAVAKAVKSVKRAIKKVTG